MLRTAQIAAVSCLIFAAPGASANWPQWRGPNLDGTSPAVRVPTAWSTEENLAWKVPLPARSGSTPIIWEDRVFLSVSFDPEADDKLELWCLDRRSGNVLWKRPLGGGNVLRYKQHMSSPSPVTDGDRVWVLTGTGVLRSFSFEGEPGWSRDLQADYGPFGQKWGYAASPLLVDDSLYVAVLHGWHTDEPSYLLRIDKASGETRWRRERPEKAHGQESPDAYTTPMLLRRAAGTEIVLAGADVLTGHDPADGEELWRVGGLNPGPSATQRLVASPLIADGMVFAFGKRGPILAFRAAGEGVPQLEWSAERGTDVPTPVTDGTYLYVVNDKGIAWCFDIATGETVYGPERLAVGTYSASPVLAEGRIYATSEEGVTTVFTAGPKLEIVATNRLEGYTLSTPAVADGQIFLRTADYLYAIGRPAGERAGDAR